MTTAGHYSPCLTATQEIPMLHCHFITSTIANVLKIQILHNKTLLKTRTGITVTAKFMSFWLLIITLNISTTLLCEECIDYH